MAFSIHRYKKRTHNARLARQMVELILYHDMCDAMKLGPQPLISPTPLPDAGAVQIMED